MRNLIDAYAKSVGAWATNLGTNNLNRTIAALDAMQQGTYGTKELARDLFGWWTDFSDFRAPAAVGFIPTAALHIPSWNANEASNFVQIPAGSFASLVLTPVVNPQTNTALTGLQLRDNNGQSSVRVAFVAATAGSKPTGADMDGLFHGAIYHTMSNELIAHVVVRTHFP